MARMCKTFAPKQRSEADSHAMAEEDEIYDRYVIAFKSGNKPLVEQVLPLIPQPATIKTTFEISSWYPNVVALVSLVHLAAYWGWANVVTALVSVYKCAANCKDERGHIPLHYAAVKGHLEVVKYFVVELLCDPKDRNNYGRTPLHFACNNGHLNISQYLIREEHCNPSCRDNGGNAPLHSACRYGHLNIARYLIREEHCNPSCENNNADTPLHYACLHNHAHIVQYLLSTGRVNPLTENKLGDTALIWASVKYDLIKLFQPFKECRTAFPVHTFTKVILTGDSGAGKTTITEVIVRLARSTAVECVTDVKRLTAGIVPHRIQSEQLGNYVVYDFAGQREYYSSHASVLEQVMPKSAAMFLCVVDLSESKEKICVSLHYWLSFINNACSTAEGQSHVVIVGSHADQVTSSAEEKEKSSVIVGSHADQVTSSAEEKEKSSLLQEIAVRRIKCQKYTGYLSTGACLLSLTVTAWYTGMQTTE